MHHNDPWIYTLRKKIRQLLLSSPVGFNVAACTVKEPCCTKRGNLQVELTRKAALSVIAHGRMSFHSAGRMEEIQIILTFYALMGEFVLECAESCSCLQAVGLKAISTLQRMPRWHPRHQLERSTMSLETKCINMVLLSPWRHRDLVVLCSSLVICGLIEKQSSHRVNFSWITMPNEPADVLCQFVLKDFEFKHCFFSTQ